jgi:hypothetical protein
LGRVLAAVAALAGGRNPAAMTRTKLKPSSLSSLSSLAAPSSSILASPSLAFDHYRVQKFFSIERRLERTLRDLRLLRAELSQSVADKGVLGSRGLTEFCLCLLQADNAVGGYTILEILRAAETAGYAVPSARTLSKRLGNRSYRVGDVECGEDRKWRYHQEGRND